MNNQLRNLETVNDAYQLLRELGATQKLLLHVMLVAEAAELLIDKLDLLKIKFDRHFVRLGVALHDSGKIIHPRELIAKGNNHENDGEQLLIANGVDRTLARCCRSHAQWQTMECSLEELLIALSDKLGQGKRSDRLENLVITRLAAECNKEYWDLFLELDSCFEKIASDGHSRLLRSK